MWTYYRLPHLRPRDPAPSLVKVGTMQTFFFESSFAPSFEVGTVMAEALNVHELTGLTPAQLQARVAELEGALAALELAANTVSACYSRNPANFASALSNLGAYAASARVLRGAST